MGEEKIRKEKRKKGQGKRELFGQRKDEECRT
jgi:hypothetical protein